MQSNRKFREMKHLNSKKAIILILSLLTGLLTSFSPISEKEEAIARNIEVLSKGEGSTSIDCIYVEGWCHINGITYPGMTYKN